ncbi:MAG: multicopper oxidase domain-containing protein [Bacteroidetes bacterium]|nr:multicopper oxidase domain-containing protein [Bacteroidota bacterium]
MYDGVSFRVFGLTHALTASPKIPAPIIYCNEGDSVVLNALSISQTDHHTIHLHGLDVNTRNDGDPATSFYLSHLQDTTYSFRARHAGSYLYHCHVGDVVHVQMGMYGMIVVRAAGGAKQIYTGGPTYSKDYNWLMSEVDRSWHDSIPVHDTKTDRINLPRYVPDYFLINGKSEWEIGVDSTIHVVASQNEPVLLRLANIGFYDNRVIFPKYLQAKVYESDGRIMPKVIATDTLLISPGERFGVLILPNDQQQDSIRMEYLNMNTGLPENVQHIPVSVTGIYTNTQDVNLDKTISVYPNPTSGVFNITYNSTDLLNVELFSSQGKVLLNSAMIMGNLTLDLSAFPVGLYYLRMTSDDAIFTKKIIKD